MAILLHPAPAPIQDGKVADLVKQLGSGSLEEREDASQKLMEMGPAALPALRKLSENSNPDLALRVRNIIERLKVGAEVPANLQTLIPGLVGRIVGGGGDEWGKIFFEVINSKKDPNGLHARMKPDDLTWLISQALSRGTDTRLKSEIFSHVEKSGMRSAIPALIATLKNEDRKVRGRVQCRRDIVVRVRRCVRSWTRLSGSSTRSSKRILMCLGFR